jgi:16S rRNA (cytosine1402-N4)-methyltransferase
LEKSPHIPVLLDETINGFSDIDSGYIIDCTTGYAGHSYELLKSNPNIKLICNDKDITAINFSKNRLKEFEDRVIFNQGDFSQVIEKFKEYPIRGVLADIGVSSLQLDHRERGFSFDSDVLDMRMNQDNSFSAYNVVNEYSQSQLEYIFKEYGEIREYRKLASLIIQARSKEPIKSAKELSKIATQIKNYKKIHPATLLFQAVRIEVNQELEELNILLDSIEKNLKDATISIITFHSLEDRVVKNRFRVWSQDCICSAEAIRCECSKDNSKGKIITRKPITASSSELKYNPRSRSAKLRLFKIKL